MNKEILIRYAEVKAQIKALQLEADTLNEQIVNPMIEQGIDKIESEIGDFYFTNRKSYTYSEAVDTASEALKQLKKQEEESGVAKVEISKSLTFKSK